MLEEVDKDLSVSAFERVSLAYFKIRKKGASFSFLFKPHEIKRVVLKLSAVLMGSQSFGIDQSQLDHYAKNIKDAVDSGIESLL